MKQPYNIHQTKVFNPLCQYQCTSLTLSLGTQEFHFYNGMICLSIKQNYNKENEANLIKTDPHSFNPLNRFNHYPNSNDIVTLILEKHKSKDIYMRPSWDMNKFIHYTIRQTVRIVQFLTRKHFRKLNHSSICQVKQ